MMLRAEMARDDLRIMGFVDSFPRKCDRERFDLRREDLAAAAATRLESRPARKQNADGNIAAHPNAHRIFDERFDIIDDLVEAFPAPWRVDRWRPIAPKTQ